MKTVADSITSTMCRYMAKSALTAALLTSSIFSLAKATEIPTGLSWLPSDPLDITLDGNQTYDLWLNLSSSSNGSRTAPFIFMGNPMGDQPYFIPGNPGGGMFPGNSMWAPIKSQLWTNGHTQGELIKVSNGTGGGPYPAGSTIYYGGASPIANTDGGTLGAKATAINDIQTVTFQLSLGEAYGYTLWDSGGDGLGPEDMPSLLVYDTSGGLLATLQADYADIIKKAYNGSMDMPPGSGVDEDVYINTFGLQWDLSALSGSVGSFQINWTGVQHAQLWSFRIDQTDSAYSDFVFDITSFWTGAADGIWNNEANWSGNTIPSTVGKAVFDADNGAELTADTTVSQMTISSAQDFTISSANDSKLTIGLNVVTETNGGPTNHTISTDVVMPTTVTLDIGEDTTLAITGDISGVGFYKRGSGELTISGNNNFSGNLVFAGGDTIVSGANTTTGGSILDIKNARVILQGDNRFSADFGVKLAGTSTHGQRAYLQLGDESTGAISQTFASLNAVKPQYVKDLNPDPQADPPVYVVGGSSEISTLTVKGGIYSGYLGGTGLHENNFSLVVDGNLTLQGYSSYAGDTVIKSAAILQINRTEALSANSNIVMDGGLLALGSFSYLTPGGVNDNGITVTETFSTFTHSLGTGAGQVRFIGNGGFRAVGGDRVVNLGGAGAQVTWGEGYFIGNGNKLILSSDNVSKITFANAIDLGSGNRIIEVESNSTAEVSGVISGTGGLIKAGSGFLFLSGLNEYTGATRIEAGQLRISEIGNAGSPSILGNTSNAAANLVLAGGQLNYVGSGNSSTDRRFTIAGATGTVASNGTGALHFTNIDAIEYNYAGNVNFELRGSNNSANRFDSLIADNGSYITSFTKAGAQNADSGGYWILGNEANSYTGATFVNSGILEVTKLSNGGQNSSIGRASNAATNLKFFRAGMRYTGDGDSTDRLFSISTYGAAYSANRIDSSGTGALKFTNTGAIGQTTGAGGATGVIGTGGHLALGGTNTDDNTMAVLIGGSSTTSSRLTKDGTGRWILTNANSSYKGVTEILGGVLGVYKLANGDANSSIGSSTNAADRLLLNGGTLQYLGTGDTTNRRFTVGSSGAGFDSSGSGAVVFNNTAAVTYATAGVNRAINFSGSNTGNNTMSASIGDAGEGVISVNKTGDGNWNLNGNNTYTGGTNVSGGTLVASHANALGTGAATINNGGTLEVAQGHTISNAITLNEGGELKLNGSITQAVTFAGGTLSGNGTLNQELVIGSGANELSVLSPGNSPGESITLSQTWASGGTYLWEMNDADGGSGVTWDHTQINGTLEITATTIDRFNLDIASLGLDNLPGLVHDFNPFQDYSWVVATASGGISGFNADYFNISTAQFQNDFVFGINEGEFSLRQSGNSLYLDYVAAPEPSRAILLLMSLVALTLRRKRSA